MADVAEVSSDYPFANIFNYDKSETNYQTSAVSTVIEAASHLNNGHYMADDVESNGFHGFPAQDGFIPSFDEPYRERPVKTNYSEEDESTQNSTTDNTELSCETTPVRKKKGRPPGSKNKTRPSANHSSSNSPRRGRPPKSSPRPPKEPKPSREPKTPKEPKPVKEPKQPKTPTDKDTLPKPEPKAKIPRMKSNVHNKKMSEEEIQEYKKLPSFIQPVVCYQVAHAVDLNQCRECYTYKSKKKLKKKSRKGDEVDCRFYQFRKLRYVDDKIEVVGFLDPDTDPETVDREVWLPPEKERSKYRIQQSEAKFMLDYVADEMCRIIEKERMFKEKYQKSNEPIIWKRLLEQMSENCDLCSTTLFNFHLICSICGISLCVDCVEEGAKMFDSESEIKYNVECSKKNELTNKNEMTHKIDDLRLTQIIVGDSLEQTHHNLHEACLTWGIELFSCVLDVQVDESMKNIAKNSIHEAEYDECLLQREIPHKIVQLEKDKLDWEKLSTETTDAVKIEPEEEMNMYFNYCEKDSLNAQKVEICQPIRHLTLDGRDTFISEPRVMNESLTGTMEVPHSWLCNGKLLRLKDPHHKGNQKMFEDQWKRGLPVLISNVAAKMKQDLWTPQSFSAEFGDKESDLINCLTGNLVRDRKISEFWDGFEYVGKRLKDMEGKPMLLKLKDWPPDSDFLKIMPTRFQDIMDNLPFGTYTQRQGNLNIVKYLPSSFLHPDLGPKGYFAYGSPFHLKEGTTNLHLDVSDACNVMCYVGIPRDQNVDEYVSHGVKAVQDGGCDRANVMRMIKDGEIPGAIWHIFNAADADKIRDFLKKILSEDNYKIAPGHDVIHDQNWYLDKEMRKRLYKEYLVQGLAIAQYAGDCIILPAGTPHQVRNIFSCIKVAEDFVSPQQISHCLHLSDEFRKLTKTHTNNEEKINIKNVVYHTVKEAVFALKHQLKTRISRIDQFNKSV